MTIEIMLLMTPAGHPVAIVPAIGLIKENPEFSKSVSCMGIKNVCATIAESEAFCKFKMIKQLSKIAKRANFCSKFQGLTHRRCEQARHKGREQDYFHDDRDNFNSGWKAPQKFYDLCKLGESIELVNLELWHPRSVLSIRRQLSELSKAVSPKFTLLSSYLGAFLLFLVFLDLSLPVVFHTPPRACLNWVDQWRGFYCKSRKRKVQVTPLPHTPSFSIELNNESICCTMPSPSLLQHRITTASIVRPHWEWSFTTPETLKQKASFESIPPWS